jgi:hypothetical protein
MVEGMMQDMWSLPRFGGDRGDATATAVDAEAARMNPWLRWRPKRPDRPLILSVAELAECTCPELCERDHANE